MKTISKINNVGTNTISQSSQNRLKLIIASPSVGAWHN
jgi:hypothetical protein